MKQVTKDMKINEVLAIDESIAPILMEAGMHCLGCPSAQLETLEEACDVHILSCDELVNRINAYLEAK